MASKKSVKSVSKDDTKLFAFLGVLLTVVGFLIVLLTKKENKYAMFYAKQGLVLFIVWVVVAVISNILLFLPFIGWVAYWILYLVLVVLWVIGMIYALSGEEKEIPLIGSFAKKINV